LRNMLDFKQLTQLYKSLKAKYNHEQAQQLLEVLKSRVIELSEKDSARKALEGEGACDMMSFLGYQPSKAQKLIDDFFERTKNSGKRFKCVFGFRGLGKTAYERSLIIKKKIKNPERKTLIYSSKKELAQDMLMPIRSTFENHDKLKLHFGDLKGETNWAKDKITLRTTELAPNPDNVASIETGGVDANIASKHYDDIFIDDIIGKDNVLNSKFLEAAAEAIPLLIPLLNPGGVIYVFAMLWGRNDFYIQELLKKRTDICDFFLLPPILCANMDHPVDAEGNIILYPIDKDGQKTEDKIGNDARVALDPERYPLTELDYRRSEIKNEALWASHYMQNPVTADGKVMDFDKLIPINAFDYITLIDQIRTRTVQRSELVMFVDTANTVSAQSNPYGISIWRYDKNTLDIVKFWKLKYMMDDAVKFLAEQIIYYGLTTCLLEKSGAYENVRFYLRKELNARHYANCMIDSFSHKGVDKRVRQLSIVPYMLNSSVRICPDFAHEVEKNGKLESMHKALRLEMDTYPDESSQAQDNILDTFSPVCEYFGLDTEYWDPGLLDSIPKKSYTPEELSVIDKDNKAKVSDFDLGLREEKDNEDSRFRVEYL